MAKSHSTSGPRCSSSSDSAIIADYTAATRPAVTLFDRGVPDCVAYAMASGLDLGPASDAASRYPYEEPVFAAGLWEEIWRPQLHAWVTAA